MKDFKSTIEVDLKEIRDLLTSLMAEKMFDHNRINNLEERMETKQLDYLNERMCNSNIQEHGISELEMIEREKAVSNNYFLSTA